MIYNVSEDGYNIRNKIYIYTHTQLYVEERNLDIERINIRFGKKIKG